MSEPGKEKTDQNKSEVAQQPGVVVGKGKTNPISKFFGKLNSFLTAKPWLTIIVLVLLLALVVGGIYWSRRNNNQPEVIDGTPAEFTGDVATVADQAYNKTATGDPEGAIAVLDDFLANNQENNSPDIAWVYSVKANIETRYVKGDAAINSVLKAIEIAPSDPRYYAQAGDYYLIAGEEKKSNEYYQKALAAYDAGLPAGYSGPDREYFAKKADN